MGARSREDKDCLPAMAKPRMCPHCRAFIDASERVCPYCDGELGPVRRGGLEPATALRGLIPSTHFTTFIILAINFGIFAATLLLTQKLGSASMFSVDGEVLVRFGAKFRYLMIVDEQWWRLITAGFLHAGVFHILMNSWVLFDLGAQVEHVFGTSRLLVIYFVSSVCGFFASTFWSMGISIGASAALCGLIGAMMAYAKRTGQSFVWSFYLRWIIMIAVIGLLIPFIDNAAHLGGFAAGYGIGHVAASPRVTHDSESLWKAAATLACAAVAVSFIIAYRSIASVL